MMSDFSGHTPGPWIAEKVVRSPHAPNNVIGRYVAQLDPEHGPSGRICECFTNCLVRTDEKLFANADLIAAAPDLLYERDELLAALKELVDNEYYSDQASSPYAAPEVKQAQMAIVRGAMSRARRLIARIEEITTEGRRTW